MSATSISVARILQLQVPIAWQEAVELARAAEASAAAASRPLLVEDCVISIDGTVHIVAGSGSSRGTPLTALGMLALLLEGQSAPPELKALVKSGETALGAFASEQSGGATAPQRDLEYFASPRPDLEIARLAERAITAAAEADAQAAIQRLRTDVADAPAAPAPPKATSGASRQRVLGMLALAAAIVLMVLAGLTVRGLLIAPTTAAEAAAGPDPAPTAPSSAIAMVVDALKRALAPQSATTVANDSENGGESKKAAGPRRARPGNTTATPVAGANATPTEAAASPSGPADTNANLTERVYPATTMDEVVVRATPPVVYSQRDSDVVPPAFLYPQMPTEPTEARRDPTTSVEVIVDERGQVTQVRLRSNDASLNDRMIVAAAKAWRFRPAVKDGRPVAYVMRVPLTR